MTGIDWQSSSAMRFPPERPGGRPLLPQCLFQKAGPSGEQQQGQAQAVHDHQFPDAHLQESQNEARQEVIREQDEGQHAADDDGVDQHVGQGGEPGFSYSFLFLRGAKKTDAKGHPSCGHPWFCLSAGWQQRTVGYETGECIADIRLRVNYSSQNE